MALAVDLLVILGAGVIACYCIYRLLVVDVVKAEEVEVDNLVYLRGQTEDGRFFDGPRCKICGVSCEEPPDYQLIGTETSWACHEHLDYVLAMEQCERCTSYVRCWHSEDDDPDNPSNYWPDPRGCKDFEDMGHTE